MTKIKYAALRGERALFGARGLCIEHSIFEDGESPLKHSRELTLLETMFRWKYPLWYSREIRAEGCTFFEMARAGIWYSESLEFRGCVFQAPKCFRRCTGLTLENVTLSDAKETLWSCRDVKLQNVQARGDYFGMNCENVTAQALTLDGNYAFDGAKNLCIRGSRLLTKDAFWNCENVTVYDSLIAGEYFGWNSKNVTLVNCTVESLQGFCYIENLKLVNCRLPATTYAFEYSEVDAQLSSPVQSVFNPSRGRIEAERIGTLILEPDRIDPAQTQIVCGEIGARADRPEWRNNDDAL